MAIIYLAVFLHLYSSQGMLLLITFFKTAILRLFMVLAIVMLVHPFGLVGQNVPDSLQLESNKVGKVRQLIPAVTYTSDLGIIGAGVLATFNYGDGAKKPYDSYTRLLGAISTKGFASFGIINDKNNAFNSNWRILSIADVGRLFNNNYFGVGNQTTFNEQIWADQGFNFFYSYNASIDITARYPLRKRLKPTDPLIDIYTRAQINYRKTESESGRLLAIEQPLGFGTGFVNELGIGFIYDGRDNELTPTSGTRLDLELGLATSAFGSDWNSRSVMFQLRHFREIPIALPTVLALQYFHLHRFGDVPFWNKPALGGDTQLRGYVLNRFIGDGANLFTSELRSWVYEPEGWPVKFGLQAFYEMGRVFDQSQTTTFLIDPMAQIGPITEQRVYGSQSFFEDYQTTYGFGFSIGFLASDLVIRGDFGRSPDINRFYLAVGYAF